MHPRNHAFSMQHFVNIADLVQPVSILSEYPDLQMSWRMAYWRGSSLQSPQLGRGLGLQIVLFLLLIKITFKFRRNWTCANFVRRNVTRRNEIRWNGINKTTMTQEETPTRNLANGLPCSSLVEPDKPCSNQLRYRVIQQLSGRVQGF